MRRLPSEGLLLFTVVLWSFNFTAVRFGVTHGIDPLVYVAIRWTLAGAALGAVVLVAGKTLWLGRRDTAVIAAASLVGVVANQIVYGYSFHLAKASTVALVFGTLPIFVSIFSQVAGHERLRRRHWLATAISFSGVALVGLGVGGGLSGSVGGVLLALATVVTFALYSVAIVPALRRHSSLQVNAVSCLSGGAVLCVVSVPWFHSQSWGTPPALAWSAIAYSAIGSIVLGNVFWFAAVNRVGAGRTALYANLQPFLGAVFGLLVLSEHLTGLQLVGGLVIASGIVVGGRSRVQALPPE